MAPWVLAKNGRCRGALLREHLLANFVATSWFNKNLSTSSDAGFVCRDRISATSAISQLGKLDVIAPMHVPVTVQFTVTYFH